MSLSQTGLNPDLGWLIPVAQQATEPILKTAAIDPNLSETLYAIAAIIYALAGYRRWRWPKNFRKSSLFTKQKESKHEQ